MYLKDNEILYNDAQYIFQIQSISYKYTYSICIGMGDGRLFNCNYDCLLWITNILIQLQDLNSEIERYKF